MFRHMENQEKIVLSLAVRRETGSGAQREEHTKPHNCAQVMRRQAPPLQEVRERRDFQFMLLNMGHIIQKAPTFDTYVEAPPCER